MHHSAPTAPPSTCRLCCSKRSQRSTCSLPASPSAGADREPPRPRRSGCRLERGKCLGPEYSGEHFAVFAWSGVEVKDPDSEVISRRHRQRVPVELVSDASVQPVRRVETWTLQLSRDRLRHLNDLCRQLNVILRVLAPDHDDRVNLILLVAKGERIPRFDPVVDPITDEPLTIRGAPSVDPREGRRALFLAGDKQIETIVSSSAVSDRTLITALA